jgi:hypothetical protein
MIEKREKEWNELEAKAEKLLNNPYLLLRKDAILKFYDPILRLWIYPSFEPYQVWLFNEPNFKTIHVENLKVIRAVWNRNEDYLRLNHPLEGLKDGFHTEPKLEIESIEMEKELFNKIFSDLQQIQFPVFANYRKSIGIDGIRYGIETFDFTHRTNISWWSVYPEEWQNLIEWFEKTTDFLQAKFLKLVKIFFLLNLWQK